MRVALVHYWLVSMRGGERVLEELCRLFPAADVFTLVIDPKAISPLIKGHKITTSFLQKIGGQRHYQKMLPLMPHALEGLDLTGYDLVISSEAGPAKGVITRPDALHICYCHSPMRYLWDLYPQYLSSSSWATKIGLSLFAPSLRQWDVTTAARVDHFIANSGYVAKRIEKFYRRKSTVINPPVSVERFYISQPGDYYLCAGQITPYKRVELAVKACTVLNRKLLVVGEGATAQLRRLAGPTVKFLPPPDNETMAKFFSSCRALLYPGVEDFGILPIEVMASGRPVIAYGRGGAVETVVPDVTGILFDDQSAEGMCQAIKRFEEIESQFVPETLRAHAGQFGRERFSDEISRFVQDALAGGGLA